jgi:hypothetical protein
MREHVQLRAVNDRLDTKEDIHGGYGGEQVRGRRGDAKPALNEVKGGTRLSIKGDDFAVENR